MSAPVDLWCRLIVSAYPRPFRARFGDDLLDAYISSHGEPGNRFRFWRTVLGDLIVAVPREHMRGLRIRRGARAEDLARRAVYRHGGASGGGGGGSSGRPRPESGAMLHGLVSDLRLGVRGLWHAPAFATVVVLSLAVGIGANAALLTIIEATWFAPVPGVAEQDRVVELLIRGGALEQGEWSFPDYLDVRSATTPLAEVAGWRDSLVALETEGAAQSVHATFAAPEYFRVLGVEPARGRVLLESEGVGHGDHPVAILSHSLWQRRFGRDQDIVGRAITLNRVPYTVVGVMPEEFEGHRPAGGGTDLWLPLMQHAYLTRPNEVSRDRDTQWLFLLARLNDGASIQEADAAVQTVMARLAQEYPESNERRVGRVAAYGIVPAANRAGDMIVAGVLVALAVVILVIICGNVAGMLLVRSVSREQDIAVRLALGSSRTRLVRQLMVEALVLGLSGGGLGILLAFWGAAALDPASVGMMMTEAVFRPSITILVASLGLTLLATVTFGLLPAIRFSRPELLSSLKDDLGGGGRRVGRIHRVAASAQTGVALLLLVICGLFLRSVGLMESRDLGFEPNGLLTTGSDTFFGGGMRLHDLGYDELEQAGVLIDELQRAIGSLPGVSSMAVADGIPLDLSGNFASVSRGDRPVEPSSEATVEYTRVTEGYFETIGATILQGRAIQRTDDASSEPVVVITEELAAKLWPGQAAVGRQLRSGADTLYAVAGVVADVPASVASRDLPHVFFALRQGHSLYMMAVVRVGGDTSVAAGVIQSAVVGVDANLPVPVIHHSADLVARSTQPQRAAARLGAGFGLLALALSAVGVYGVVAFAVSSRTREVGIRMAMGATRENVVRSVLVDAVRLAVPGLTVGAFLAAGTGAAMRSEFLGVSPVDPATFAVAAALLFGVVLLASLVPARRASRIDPMDALRYE